jgi:DsbC/DsbD-like thiol-disulfide interchange protein
MRLRLDSATKCLRTWLLAGGFAVPLAAGLVPATASDTVETIGARLHLISGAVSNGVAHVGLAIDLQPGWHTYWRYPGDSGVPPDITAAGAGTVGGITVDYPAPMRFGDASDQTIGYQGSVMLLVNVTLLDPQKPADLSLHVRLGVCREICVPVDETLTLPLDPAASPDKADAAMLAAAATQVPQSVSTGADLSVTGIKRDTSVKPEMVTFTVKGSTGQLSDVFVEGPEGWALPLPTRVSGTGDESVWSFVLDGLPSGADPKGATLTFTLVGKAKSTTQALVLQ